MARHCCEIRQPGHLWSPENAAGDEPLCPRMFEVCCAPPSYRAENETQMCPIPQKPASVVLLLRLSPIAFSYYGSRFVQAILCSSKYFERNARRKNGREDQRKDRYTGKEKTRRRR